MNTGPFPQSSFPTTVWNGLTATRLETGSLKEPDSEDWDRLVSEVIAIQQYLISIMP